MKKKNISLLLVMFLLASLILTACGNKGEEVNEELTLEDIKEKGTLILGTDGDYPPFEFHVMIDGKDEIVGLDIEIAKYIADQLDVNLEIKEMDFSNLLGGLSTGMLDIVIAGMNPNPEREKEALFSNIYYEANSSIVTREGQGENIKDLDDLKGKKVGVQMGTTHEEFAKSLDGVEVVSLKSNVDVIMNLKTEKIDFGIMETPVSKSFVEVNKDLEIIDELVIEDDSGGVAIATNKNNAELVSFLNEIIEELSEKGLIEEWLIEAQQLSDEQI